MNEMMELYDYGKSRHKDMIAEAENYRRYSHLDDNYSGQVGRLLAHLRQKFGQNTAIRQRPALSTK